MSRFHFNFSVRISRRPIGVAVLFQNCAVRVLVGFVLFELEVLS